MRQNGCPNTVHVDSRTKNGGEVLLDMRLIYFVKVMCTLSVNDLMLTFGLPHVSM